MTYFYHAVVDSPHRPRDLDTDSAQTAVISLLGELWPSEQRVPVPSSAIVAILARMGVSEAATRGALSRMQRRGTLDLVRDGRQTSYRLSEDVAESIPRSEVLTMGFGAEDRPWEGEWTLVVFSIPEAQRDKRQTLREWLRWLGFGPVRDGVWVSPHADVRITDRAIRDLLPPDGLVFRSAHVVGEIRPADVWPLDDIRRAYENFIEDFRPCVYDLRAGSVAPIDAMRLWITVLGKWRSFPTIDPDLPAAALPADWPRPEARRIFEAIHDACGPIVATYVRSVLAEAAPEAAQAARAMAVSDAYELYSRIVADASIEPEPDLRALGPAHHLTSA